MQNPAAEVEGVILALTTAVNADVQKAAVERYFAPDASFRHPLCAVPSSSLRHARTVFPPSATSPVHLHTLFPRLSRLLSPTSLGVTASSRDTILKVYQWYRVMSPILRLRVQSVVYNEPRKQMYVEAVQRFHIRWNVFMPSAESRLLTHITLRAVDAGDARPLYVIEAQEDFYHPEDLLAFVLPLFVPLLFAVLLLATWACVLGAWLGAATGLWNVRSAGVQHERSTSQEEPQRTTDNSSTYADKVKMTVDGRVNQEWPTPKETEIMQENE